MSEAPNIPVDTLSTLGEDGIHTESCPRCRGDGHEPGFGHDIHPAAISPCKRCKGSGVVRWKVCGDCEGMDPVGCPGCDGAVRIDL